HGPPGHAARSALAAGLVCVDHLSARARARRGTRRSAKGRRCPAGAGGTAGHRRAELGVLAAAVAVPQPLASARTAPPPPALLAARARADRGATRPVGTHRGNDLEPPRGRVQPPLRAVRAPATGVAAVALLCAGRHGLPARVSARPGGRR